MRRGSLAGPLLLILIGGLFLLNNLRPDLPLMDLVARYWPFVLIGWGVLRLAEILLLAARSRPLPGAGISGGEWALVVLISIVGSGIFLAHRYSHLWPHGRITMRGIEIFGESYDYPLAAQKAAGKAPRVVVENLRGNIRVVGADTGEVKVTGRKTIRAFHQNDANTANQQSPLEIAVQGERVAVRTNQERVSGGQRVSADLEITVPRGATLEARGRYGDIDVSDILGNVEIDSDNAGVRLHNIGGSARVDLRRSDIVRVAGLKGSLELKGRGEDVDLESISGQVTVAGSYSGDLQFRNLAMPLQFQSGQTELRVAKVPGQIRMALGNFTAENVAGPIRLNTGSKDVQITGFTDSLEVSLDRGDIEIQPVNVPLARMEIETRNGNVDLALPAAAKFQVIAVARRGEVENEWGEPLKTDARRPSKEHAARIEGSVGGGPLLKVSTGRGTVTIRKSDGMSRKPAGTKAERPAESLPPVELPEPPKPPRPPGPIRFQKL